MDPQMFFDIAGNLGYFLLLVSFFMGELWKLRWFTILANCCIIFHFYFAYPEPSWIPICWAIAYNVINGVQLVRERKPSGAEA